MSHSSTSSTLSKRTLRPSATSSLASPTEDAAVEAVATLHRIESRSNREPPDELVALDRVELAVE